MRSFRLFALATLDFRLSWFLWFFISKIRGIALRKLANKKKTAEIVSRNHLSSYSKKPIQKIMVFFC